MNPVASLSRVFECDADTLFATLERLDQWWGEGAAAQVVKRVAAEQLTLSILIDDSATRAILVLSPGGASPSEGTQLQVLHTRFANQADRNEHAELWESRLDSIASLL